MEYESVNAQKGRSKIFPIRDFKSMLATQTIHGYVVPA